MTWLAHLRRSLPVRRVVTALAVTSALLLCPLPASGGAWWDIGIAVGYIALVFAATLYLYPLRGEGLPHRRLFTLSQHRRIGWIALTLCVLHAAILLIAQPLVGHYLLPSTPLYMLLGIAALVALAVLIGTGLSARSALRKATSRGLAARTAPEDPSASPSPLGIPSPPLGVPSLAARSLAARSEDQWASPPRTSSTLAATSAPTAAPTVTSATLAAASARTAAPPVTSATLAGAPARTAAPAGKPPTSISIHAVLAALFPALTGAHLIGSAQLLDKPTKAITACLLLALPLLWAAYRSFRRQARLATTALPCCAAALALLLLPIPTASPRLLQQATQPSLLPTYFPHEKHTTVNCVTCHHNFIDKTGIGSCLDCHRPPRPDLPQSPEATFHTFCRTCHTQLAELTTQTKHGPTRSCSTCHTTLTTHEKLRTRLVTRVGAQPRVGPHASRCAPSSRAPASRCTTTSRTPRE